MKFNFEFVENKDQQKNNRTDKKKINSIQFMYLK